jgi:hypothetical protein
MEKLSTIRKNPVNRTSLKFIRPGQRPSLECRNALAEKKVNAMK